MSIAVFFIALMPQNLYQASLKISPSGRCALLYAPSSPPPCQSRQTSPDYDDGDRRARKSDTNSGDGHLKVGRGALGRKSSMSWKSGQNIKEIMAAQEKEFGRGKCWFLTITLPSIDAASYEALARYSSYAIDRLNKAFKRFFGSDRFCRSNVWEYQKRGALHAHFLISSNSINGSKITSFRNYISIYWHRILSDIGKRFGADMFLGRNGKSRSLKELMAINEGKHFINCQTVRKSVVAYLSKYLSDSSQGKDKKSKQQLRKRYFPVATWAQWDRKCTELRKKHTHKIDLGEAKNIDILSIERAFKSLEKEIPCIKGTEIKYPRNPFIRGFYFIASMHCKADTCKLLEIVKTELQWIFDDSRKYQEWLRNNRQHEQACDPSENEIPMEIEDELELRRHAKEARISQRREAKELGDYVAFLGMFMYDFIKEKATILEANPYPNYEQIELPL